jgi:hypothetical protein
MREIFEGVDHVKDIREGTVVERMKDMETVSPAAVDLYSTERRAIALCL